MTPSDSSYFEHSGSHVGSTVRCPASIRTLRSPPRARMNARGAATWKNLVPSAPQPWRSFRIFLWTRGPVAALRAGTDLRFGRSLTLRPDTSGITPASCGHAIYWDLESYVAHVVFK